MFNLILSSSQFMHNLYIIIYTCIYYNIMSTVYNYYSSIPSCTCVMLVIETVITVATYNSCPRKKNSATQTNILNTTIQNRELSQFVRLDIQQFPWAKPGTVVSESLCQNKHFA